MLIADLAHGLQERGHAVTLFAASGSHVPGISIRAIPVLPGELTPADFSAGAANGPSAAFFRGAELFLSIYREIRDGGSFDMVHAHAFDWPAYAFGALLAGPPVVHTMHLPAVDPAITALLTQTFAATGSSHAVTVAQACAATYAAHFPFDRVIYNGVDAAVIPFGAAADDYLLFVGRMSPEKGADQAIAIAQLLGCRLVLAGGIYDRAFFERTIAPRLTDPRLDYRGHLVREDVYALMGRARCLLFTSRWAEPFGLTLAEAQATGTPVVAFDCGAAHEIVVPGRTGYLVPPGDIFAAAAAVTATAGLDRAACRRHITEHFSLERMIMAYEDYYYSKLEAARPTTAHGGINAINQ